MSFNIRVYGLFILNQKILVSEENRMNIAMRKFPGGGLELGESTVNCLKREIREELGLEISDLEHFYTTDFYQESAFNKTQQLISIYYKVKKFSEAEIRTGNKKLEELKNTEEQVKWISLSELKEEDFNFPIDRYVFKLLSGI